MPFTYTTAKNSLRMLYPHHESNQFQTFPTWHPCRPKFILHNHKKFFSNVISATTPHQLQTVPMMYSYRPECPLHLPQYKFSPKIVSATIAPSEPDIQYEASLPPRMFLTYTTTKILFECCIRNKRPTTCRHSVWAILKNQNDSYIHHHFFVSSNVVSESSVPPTPNTPYWLSQTHSKNLYLAPTKILIDFYILNKRPNTSRHFLLTITIPL